MPRMTFDPYTMVSAEYIHSYAVVRAGTCCSACRHVLLCVPARAALRAGTCCSACISLVSHILLSTCMYV
jgi:hypothetical protein